MATNYTNLLALIQSAAENDDTEFVSEIPAFIDRAEDRLSRELDLRGLIVRTSVTVTAGSPFLTIPTGALYVKNLSLTANGATINLVLKTDEFITDYWPVRSSTSSTPKYYGTYSASTILIAPTPTSTLTGDIAYIKRPVTLSAATSTNFLTDFCGDALLYASMIEAGLFMKNPLMAQTWEKRYQFTLAALLNTARRERRDDMVTPTAVGTSEITVVQ